MIRVVASRWVQERITLRAVRSLDGLAVGGAATRKAGGGEAGGGGGGGFFGSVFGNLSDLMCFLQAPTAK